jgi:hypothetical protein
VDDDLCHAEGTPARHTQTIRSDLMVNRDRKRCAPASAKAAGSLEALAARLSRARPKPFYEIAYQYSSTSYSSVQLC